MSDHDCRPNGHGCCNRCARRFPRKRRNPESVKRVRKGRSLWKQAKRDLRKQGKAVTF